MSDLQETATVGPQPFPGGGRGAWRPGHVVAERYEVREYLGHGGYATVYRVYDSLVRIDVALKVVHPERDPERALLRLAREVEIARQSLDPHIVRVFDLGRTSDAIYLTMELLGGGSLRQRLDEGPLPIAEALRVAVAILQGLGALHLNKAVHRDVTPGNILFSEEGEVKLADLGIARYFGRQETQFTSGGAVLGTAGYRSPEQTLGRDVGPRSDLYSLGVVLFEMLAGSLPQEAASELGRQLSSLERMPDLRKVRPEVPRWLAAVVERLLEVRPADRYQNVEEILGDLKEERSSRRGRLRRRLFRTAAALLLCLPQAGVFVARAPHTAFPRLVPDGKVDVMYRLVVIYKEQSPVFEVPDEEACLGSAAENDLVLRVRGISRRHALIRRYPGGVEVIDTGSKNGLLVEGRRVERTILTPGLRVQIGEAWLELQEISTPESGHAPGEGSTRLRELAVSSETATAAHGAEPSTSTHGDALRLAYHLDRMGAGTPGLRDDLLARLRGALDATLLLGCEWRRREKTLLIRESSGKSLSGEEATRLHPLVGEPCAWPRDEVRIKRSGVFLLAGRGDLFLIAKLEDEPSAQEGWRKDFMRFLGERLLGRPPAISDTKNAALRRTLALTGGNKSETARLLKVSRQTVYNFLKRPS